MIKQSLVYWDDTVVMINIKYNDVTLLTCKETLEEAIDVAKEYRKEYSVSFIIVKKGKGDEAKIFYGH